ncbi:ABC transporter ATP-binding protein [Phototrophicus methaneseepsis]|uniref:ABC transporter ATP-binding protein n=1 Tax=Phototrophicus methaneseepsis TaxID=2710758 RepID=A0A7S8IFY0_9CHLR|nr:ABC transporter ATP-binding protein [Phototrophicus methaneseepsis]QPC84091.1 ABC transporter ATP-binding protein [Phototrophicus methaneseepsis]
MIVNNVQAHYITGSGAAVRAVDHVSLTVNEGEVLGIVGESGCGKSTFASVISLTPDRNLNIKSGEMIIDGTTVNLTDPKKIPKDWHGKLVALLPQRAMNSLNPTARIRDIIVDVVRGHYPDTPAKEAIGLAQERFEMLGLPVRVVNSYPHQLSGGMRQRVVTVISTLLNPKLLIADEPTSALDVSSQRQLITLLNRMLEQQVIRQIIYITHDLPMLSNLAHRIGVMYAGELVEIGTTEEIVNKPQHPYTQSLIGATLDLDPSLRGQRIEGITGAPPDLRYPPSGCRFHPRCKHAMDICTREEPPVVGEPERFATCWWVQEKQEAASALAQEVR